VSYRHSRQGDDDTDRSGNEQPAYHAPAQQEHPEQRARQDWDLPKMAEGEAERDRGAGDGANDGGARSRQECLDGTIRSNLIEMPTAHEDEGERRGEGDERRQQPATHSPRRIADHGHGPDLG
jgi:hypothetical protein